MLPLTRIGREAIGKPNFEAGKKRKTVPIFLLMKKHASISKYNYPVYSDAVQRVEDLLEIDFPSEKVILFLAGDYSNIDSQLIAEIGKGLIAKELVYVCTWGPDCEKAHDAFDRGSYKYEKETQKEFHLMTSWHEKDTLEEAL